MPPSVLIPRGPGPHPALRPGTGSSGCFRTRDRILRVLSRGLPRAARTRYRRWVCAPFTGAPRCRSPRSRPSWSPDVPLAERDGEPAAIPAGSWATSGHSGSRHPVGGEPLMADTRRLPHAGATTIVVALPVQIDMTNADQVGKDLDAAFDPGVGVVIADMSGTSFCDTSGIRAGDGPQAGQGEQDRVPCGGRARRGPPRLGDTRAGHGARSLPPAGPWRWSLMSSHRHRCQHLEGSQPDWSGARRALRCRLVARSQPIRWMRRAMTPPH